MNESSVIAAIAKFMDNADINEVDPKASLYDNGLDSLDEVELFMELERIYGVNLDELGNAKGLFITPEELSEYIYSRQSDHKISESGVLIVNSELDILNYTPIVISNKTSQLFKLRSTNRSYLVIYDDKSGLSINRYYAVNEL